MFLVSSVVIVMVVVAARACPPACDCRSYPRNFDATGVYYATLKCKGDVNLTASLPDNVETLAFENTTIDLDVLVEELCHLRELPYFSRLSLRRLALPNFCNASVSGLDRLRFLEVSNCRVDCVPQLNLTGLQELDVSGNELKVIRDEQFRTLPILVLNLSANAIETIEPNGFADLHSLTCLDLSRNSLTSLKNKVLVPLTTLQHLNLSNNRLEVLDEACFSGLQYLQQLDVSWNRLARVAPGTLQLPSLARLLLAGNPQLGGSREPALFVGTGRRLQTVDASRTGLKQVPAALTHSIRTLRLAGNSIPTVRCGDLDSYPLLQLLDFTSNQLADIEEDALGRLDSLTILYLSDNRLRTVPHSLPERLRVLHLEHNEIETVQTSDLQGLVQLEVLLLSGNRIRVVKDAAFSQLTSLTSLDLSHNPIKELPTGSLAGPAELRVLRLAGLNVISPAKEVEFPLPAPEHLITLDLSSSPGLARQMLADTAALAAARELQDLNLATAGLNYIRSDLLHFLPQLRVLHLQENPLNCTGMQWLAQWMRQQDEPPHRAAMCASPPELWGTPLVDLQGIEADPTVATKDTTQTPTTPEHEIAIAKSGKRINQILKNDVYPAKLEPPLNVTSPTGEMSMYSAPRNLTHPGMLILAAGIAGVIAVLATLARIRRKRRLPPDHEDIEVSSLPSVTELW